MESETWLVPERRVAVAVVMERLRETDGRAEAVAVVISVTSHSACHLDFDFSSFFCCG